MKIKIIQDYIDRETGKKVKANTEIETTEERGEELIKKGKAEKINNNAAHGSWARGKEEKP